MNHKRHKPRKMRGHCHLCKYYKDIGNSKTALHVSRLRQEEATKAQIQQT